MAVELATGYVRLMPSARGFQQAVNREISGDLRRVGESSGTSTAQAFSGKFSSGMRTAGKAAGVALAGAFSGAAIFGKKSIDAASDLEESQNKVNVVFGEGADEITAWAKTAASRMGQSRQQALDAAGSFGNLFTQLGLSGEAAGGMSTEMVELASDFASFHNADISEVLQAQQAAFRGEYDAVQRFVPTINAAAVEQRALEMGLANSTGELDAQDKALATQALLMEGAGQAAGDFARTSDGLANQQRIASASFQDLQATIGTALIPVLSKVMEVAIQVTEAIKRNWPQIKATIQDVIENIRAAWENVGRPIFDQMREIVETTVEVIQLIWRNFGDEITAIVRSVWRFVSGIIKGAMDVIHGIIKTVMSLIRGEWGDAWDGVKQLLSGVLGILKTMLQGGVDQLKAVWSGILGIFNFFKDQVAGPIERRVGEFRDLIAGVVQSTVDKVKTAWSGIRAIVDFFRESVYDPIKRRIDQLTAAVVTAFEKAVDGVQAAWDTLKAIVRVPVNVVIGFYNNGIRKLWNNIISKIPGIGDLPEVATLNRGGWVPGTGNRDTVPAVLTPGEFVITKKAAKRWGPGVLAALNDPRGTIDPGIFGYAAGGYVRSADEALAWARQQNGKPYRFPLVGPDAYDCSGFTSALINYILGRNPYARRHSSGTMAGDPALARGAGDNPMGALFGARPPYMTNAQGARVGHTTATLMGVNMEATPPRVRVGGAARGARSLTQLFHLPGYGGLSDGDKNVVASAAVLSQARLGEGGNFFADTLHKLVNQLPGMLYDFVTKQLPQIVVRAIKGVVSKIADTLNPFGSGIDYEDIVRRMQQDGTISGFARGGTVRQNGPMIVGEDGPELLWGSEGQYVESNDRLRGRYGRGPSVVVNNHRSAAGPSEIARGIQMARVGAR